MVALLMASGLPYDSDSGRDYAACITAIMCGEAYKQSSVIAEQCLPLAPASPCGQCRQFLREFDGVPSLTVVAESPSGDRLRWTLAELLPESFGPEALGVPSS